MLKKELVPLGIIAVMFAIGFYILPQLPNEVPVHFTETGLPDLFGSKLWGALLIPLLSLTIYFFFILVPKVLIHNQKKLDFYIHHLAGLETAFFLFMFIIYLSFLILIIGYAFDIALIIAPALSVFFYYYGYLLKFAYPGFFVAIMTPWTIRDYRVWRKTHQVGSKTFRIMAFVTFFAFLAGDYFVVVFLTPIFINVAFLILYSRYQYQKATKETPGRHRHQPVHRTSGKSNF
ncbi:MAG: DUF1648 domain-containing protein [Candidatus Altiarchaeota archaeon]|nr:DUF1648 domain-containing protein [Candidatus Altiarchaeota archaeon]